MRRLALAAVACLMTATAVSAAPDPQLVAPIQKFIDSFNKGDAAAAAATHSATEHLAIIDEVAPYLCAGARRFRPGPPTWTPTPRRTALPTRS